MTEQSDNYREDISRAIWGLPGEHAFFIRAKAEKVEALALRFHADSIVRVLDVGCGAGLVEQYLRIPNSEITGLDVAEPLLEKARKNVPGCRFTCFDGKKINAEDNTYHLVFAINVFHHIDMKDRMRLLMEMCRVLRPGGQLALFEHNFWHPITRFVVSRCAFDRNAVLLSRSNACSMLRMVNLQHIKSSYIIFIPWSIGINRVLERVLGWFPLGVQYYATGIK
jgi:trans-aconitate methyltransferase